MTRRCGAHNKTKRNVVGSVETSVATTTITVQYSGESEGVLDKTKNNVGSGKDVAVFTRTLRALCGDLW